MQALTARQETILRKVVEGYRRTGQPVASKWVAADPELACRASTVRNELALLEEQGLLAHPHVSAGRVATGAGQRYVVDRMLASGDGLPVLGRGARLERSLMRREVEEAVRTTTEALSEVTSLLAVVSAPALNTASIRHVEVLALQSRVVVVVIITSTGGVSKMLVTFDHPVDPGLVTWAGEYLNERLLGTGLGARMLHQGLMDTGLSATEVEFLPRLAPAFGEFDPEGRDALYVEGTAHLFSTGMIEDTAQINELM